MNTYFLIKSLHIIFACALIGPLILAPQWLHLSKFKIGRTILKNLHLLTGFSGWLLFLSGILMLYVLDWSLISSFWIITSVLLFLFIQLFDHFWADKREEKLEASQPVNIKVLIIWLYTKLVLYFTITFLMVNKFNF